MSPLEILRSIALTNPADPGERERTVGTRLDAAMSCLVHAGCADEDVLAFVRSVAENRVLCSLNERMRAARLMLEMGIQ